MKAVDRFNPTRGTLLPMRGSGFDNLSVEL